MTEFLQIAQAHRQRYPLMQPLDFGKLAFQSEFGPEHLLTDEQTMACKIGEERETIPDVIPASNPEPIESGLCRYHLTREVFSPEAVITLARLFIRSAAEHRGTAAGLESRLTVLQSLPVEGMRSWLQMYRKQGYPPVRHNEGYRRVYQPHYRVLLETHAVLLFREP